MDNTYLRDELLEIYKDPANRGSMADPSVSVEEQNPLCGDVVTLQLKITDGAITDAKFDGNACAVSLISSALVTEDLIGKPVTYAENLTKEHVLKLIGVELTTSRVKCATLVLEALKKALATYDH